MKNGRRRLLVLEPHDKLRDLIVDYLAWMGFEVFEAGTPTEANRILNALKANGPSPLILSTDASEASRLLNQLTPLRGGELLQLMILQNPFSPRDLRETLIL